MSEHRDYGAPDSAQTPTAVAGTGSSVAPPLSADGLVPTSCKHERASGRLRLAEGCLLRETVCDKCIAVLHVFPPLTYRTPSMRSTSPRRS
jgi:hypothetical protein